MTASSEKTKSQEFFALVLVGSLREPARIGEIVLVPPRASIVLGQLDPERVPAGEKWATPVRQRPGEADERPPFLWSAQISRRQLICASTGKGLRVRTEGRASVEADGVELTLGRSMALAEGATVRIGNEASFVVVKRPARMPGRRALPDADWPAFGEADRNGIVGESAQIWEFRDHRAANVALDPPLEPPPLGARREDIPLLAQEFLRRMARRPADARLVRRFLDPKSGRFRLEFELVETLIRHEYGEGVPELERLLSASLYESSGDALRLTPGVEALLEAPAIAKSAARTKASRGVASAVGPASERGAAPTAVNPATLDSATLLAALDRNRWHIVAAARSLGLSRFQLQRRMQRLGIERPH